MFFVVPYVQFLYALIDCLITILVFSFNPFGSLSACKNVMSNETHVLKTRKLFSLLLASRSLPILPYLNPPISHHTTRPFHTPPLTTHLFSSKRPYPRHSRQNQPIKPPTHLRRRRHNALLDRTLRPGPQDLFSLQQCPVLGNCRMARLDAIWDWYVNEKPQPPIHNSTLLYPGRCEQS